MATKKYINGYDKPKFLIYYNDYTYVETIELNLCDEDGLTEEYEFLYIEHKLLDYSEEKLFNGLHIYFILSYKSWSDNTNSMKIKKLLNYSLGNYRIFIFPRVDDYRNYEVNFTGDSFNLNMMKNGMNAIGNTGIELKYKTKYKLTELDWSDPNNSRIAALSDFAVI